MVSHKFPFNLVCGDSVMTSIKLLSVQCGTHYTPAHYWHSIKARAVFLYRKLNLLNRNWRPQQFETKYIYALRVYPLALYTYIHTTETQTNDKPLKNKTKEEKKKIKIKPKIHRRQLDANAIMHLDGVSFVHLKNLRTLRIDGNMLQRVPTDALTVLPALEVL